MHAKLNTKFKRFIIVGVSTVIIDICIYFVLLKTGLYISISKSISFFTGAIYSYLVNKKWTFNTVGNSKMFLKFLLVYVAALMLNTFINNFILGLFYYINNKTIVISFFCATFISAVFNFSFLNKYVFKKRENNYE